MNTLDVDLNTTELGRTIFTEVVGEFFLLTMRFTVRSEDGLLPMLIEMASGVEVLKLN